MAKIFEKFGTVRTENLGDLLSGETALNTLLDRIKGGSDRFSFLDIEVIKNLFTTPVTSGTLNSAADATVTVTGSNGLPTVYDPLITLTNRFDRAYFTTSEPFFQGGDGPTARYFDNNQILRVGADSTTDFDRFNQLISTTPDDGRVIPNPATGIELASDVDNFWEEGDFVYGNKIRNKLLSAYGGVEWTGYFKPTRTGTHAWRFNTSGYLRVEFDNQEAPSKGFTLDTSTNTFKIDDTDFRNPEGITTRYDRTRLISAGIPVTASFTGGVTNSLEKGFSYPNVSTFVSSTTADPAATGISFDIRRDIEVGDLVVTASISGSTVRNYTVGDTFEIDGSLIGQTGNNITVTVTEVGGYFLYDGVNDVGTTEILGDTRQITIDLGFLQAFEAYKFRISFFIDEDSVEKMQELQRTGPIDKFINIDRLRPNDNSYSDFDYKFLYGDRYFDFYNIGDFKKFVDGSILSGGGKIFDKETIGRTTAPGEGAAGDRYATLVNLNPIISYYKPPLDVEVDDMLLERTASGAANQFGITLSATDPQTGQPLANRTENIEVGNYVIGPGIEVGTRVREIITNSSVIVDIAIDTSFTLQSIFFVPHKGLVAYGGERPSGAVQGSHGGYFTGTAADADGFVLGRRSVSKIKVLRGDTIVTDDALCYYDNNGTKQGPFPDVLSLFFDAAGPAAAPATSNYLGSTEYTTNSNGTGLDFIAYRNEFGALQISPVAKGSGYANFELFNVPGTLVGQTDNVILEVESLVDTFITGKPEYVIKPNQIFKIAVLPSTSDTQYQDLFTNPEVPATRILRDTQIIKRLYESNDKSDDPQDTAQLTNNTILWKDKLDDSLSEVTNLYTQRYDRGYWFIYDTFGAVNNSLGAYCQGVFDARIEQILTVVANNTGYTSSVLPSDTPVAIPANTTTVSGVGTDMKVWYKQSGGAITYIWVADPGTGYEAGDIVSIDGSATPATFTVGYTDTTSNTVTFRLSGSEVEFATGALLNGYYAHLFPSLAYNSPTNDVNDLVGEVRIQSVEYPILGSEDPGALGTYLDTAVLVTLEHESGGANAVQNNAISYVDSVITRITFTPPATPNQNKEVCFRPTDTSPPFAATSRGLTTSNEIKMVDSFGGNFNPGTLTYDNISFNTDRSTNEIAIDPINDIIGGYIPITCADGFGGTETYYMLLQGDVDNSLTGPV